MVTEEQQINIRLAVVAQLKTDDTDKLQKVYDWVVVPKTMATIMPIRSFTEVK